MTTIARAKFSNGVFTPIETLDIEEGTEVTLWIENAPPPKPVAKKPVGSSSDSLLDIIDRLNASVPESEWKNSPPDLAKNKGHYLYGWPKEDEE